MLLFLEQNSKHKVEIGMLAVWCKDGHWFAGKMFHYYCGRVGVCERLWCGPICNIFRNMCGFGVPDNDRTWPSLFVRGPRLRPLSRDTSVLVVFLVACRSNDTK